MGSVSGQAAYIAKLRIAPSPAFAEKVVQRTLTQVGTRRLPAGSGGRTTSAPLRVRHPSPAMRRPGADAGRGSDRELAREAVPVRHGGQAPDPTAGHLRSGQP